MKGTSIVKIGLLGLTTAILLLGCSQVHSVGSDSWLTDFEAAKAQAKKDGLPILADFSGSDWCGWCIKLDKEVFSQTAFKDYAKDNLVLFLADFPRGGSQPTSEKQQNQQLAETYGVSGFPTVLLLNAEGEVLARTGYRRGGADAYAKHIADLLADSRTNNEGGMK